MYESEITRNHIETTPLGRQPKVGKSDPLRVKRRNAIPKREAVVGRYGLRSLLPQLRGTVANSRAGHRRTRRTYGTRNTDPVTVPVPIGQWCDRLLSPNKMRTRPGYELKCNYSCVHMGVYNIIKILQMLSQYLPLQGDN